MTPRFQAIMSLAWQCGIARWDLLAASIPEAVLNGWMEWFSDNPVHPVQKDQFAANIAAGLMNVQGCEIKADELMRLRMLRPWSPSDDEDA